MAGITVPSVVRNQGVVRPPQAGGQGHHYGWDYGKRRWNYDWDRTPGVVRQGWFTHNEQERALASTPAHEPDGLEGLGVLGGFWDFLTQATAPLAQAGAINLATANLPAGSSVQAVPGGGYSVNAPYGGAYGPYGGAGAGTVPGVQGGVTVSGGLGTGGVLLLGLGAIVLMMVMKRR